MKCGNRNSGGQGDFLLHVEAAGLPRLTLRTAGLRMYNVIGGPHLGLPSPADTTRLLFPASSWSRMRITFLALMTLISCVPLRAADAGPKFSPEQEKFFEARIRPVLVESCYECHSAKKQQYRLRVDSRQSLLEGSDSGSVLVPGNLGESRLWDVLQHDPDDTQMPPDGKLPDSTLADIKKWIEMGAPWPASQSPGGTDVAQAADDWRRHWAYQPIARPSPPAIEQQDWPASDIDRFILAKLEAAGMMPSPEADRVTLLRRLKFDLLGLPASYEEIEAFVKDPSQSAYETIVDEYLASPHFGERWARHWLDISRYADTKGYVFREDRNYAEAWKYREWVIGAFNADLPYDRFVMLQLAADQLSDDEADLYAMGYLTLGRRFLNNRHDIIDDQIDVTTRGMMALTVTCARCHDHKYDPIPAADYYSLYGVFASCDQPSDAPSPLRMVDKQQPVEPVVFIRGQAGNRGKRVPRQFLGVVERENRQPFRDGSGRLEMAQAIASADNPLTARVWCNRVWGHLVGNELVRTPSDFGVRSDPPTHPALLDHLAGSLIDGGWSTKQLIRSIVLSSVYRQQSAASAETLQRDPNNELLSHMNRRRLDFESLRDAMLSVSGQLDLTLGGESVKLTEMPFPTRRAMYAFIDRQNLPGLFRTFDFAGPDTHAPKRYQTNVPQQALFLMNSPFVLEQADQLVALVGTDDPDQMVRRLFQRTLGRRPRADEMQRFTSFVAQAPPSETAMDTSLWSYGYGELDADAGLLKSFTPLPHFTGKAWQGGEQLPDGKLGWATLNATGGHVGNDLQHAAVRRWKAPAGGSLSIRGRLKHERKEGDGVRGRVLIDGAKQCGVWEVHNSREITRVRDAKVEAGQTIEFVTDLNQGLSHDSFEWKVVLTLDVDDKDSSIVADAEKEFSGPPPTPLDPWAQVAQVLLLSNEFQFVD